MAAVVGGRGNLSLTRAQTRRLGTGDGYPGSMTWGWEGGKEIPKRSSARMSISNSYLSVGRFKSEEENVLRPRRSCHR